MSIEYKENIEIEYLNHPVQKEGQYISDLPKSLSAPTGHSGVSEVIEILDEAQPQEDVQATSATQPFETGIHILSKHVKPNAAEMRNVLEEQLTEGVPFSEVIAKSDEATAQILRRFVEFGTGPENRNLSQAFTWDMTQHSLVTPVASVNRVQAQRFVDYNLYTLLDNTSLDVHVYGTTANGLAHPNSDIDIAFFPKTPQEVAALKMTLPKTRVESYKGQVIDMDWLYAGDMQRQAAKMIYDYRNGSINPMDVDLYANNAHLVFTPTLTEVQGIIRKPDTRTVEDRLRILNQIQSFPMELRSQVWKLISDDYLDIQKGIKTVNRNSRTKLEDPHKLGRGLLAARECMEAIGMSADEIDEQLAKVEADYRNIQMPSLPILQTIYQEELYRIEEHQRKWQKQTENKRSLHHVHISLPAKLQKMAESEPTVEPFILKKESELSLSKLYDEYLQSGQYNNPEQDAHNNAVDAKLGNPFSYFLNITSEITIIINLFDLYKDSPNGQQYYEAERTSFLASVDRLVDKLQTNPTMNNAHKEELLQKIQEARITVQALNLTHQPTKESEVVSLNL